ncbi:N-acetylmuramoyl-L-alanine amidase XlyA precursor [Streptomyces fradiae ATCC 10745 = DSM 40063]|uniref:N-acetylmuramoyl-L-alanine amidase XlyA n=2 Tax=Streptomyces fradiae TaxID=1906 RepID=A0A1Y2NXV2_STRFR|nr:N-acetylmuramoyl-L-alanine amidase XlyA precursor [Streptomyces fradiae ATCC 10745 = DSM 40063]
MTTSTGAYHVAVDHLDPDTLTPTTTYLGTCDQAHVDEVRAIAALDTSPHHLLDHPRQPGAFLVLRADGDLDVYVPVDAPDYTVRTPDPDPQDPAAGGSIDTPAPGAADRPVEPDRPRGAAGPAYIAGAVRFGAQRIGGAMDTPTAPPRAVWHTTESPAGSAYFYSIAAYLIRVGAEPQVIYDPESDRLGQFGPLTSSGRALRNDGARRTNREGRVCIQVEVLGRARSPWTNGFDPAAKPNYRKLIAAMRAHGIPDTWPAGPPPATAAAATRRDRTTWQTKGGHYGHSQVPGNDHWDPGAIDTSLVPGPRPGTGDDTPAAGSGVYVVKKGDTLSAIAVRHSTTTAALAKLNDIKDPDRIRAGQRLRLPGVAAAKPQYEPFPGAAFFHTGRRSPLVTAMGRRLVAEGCGRYNHGPGPQWTNADRASYAAWQRKLGYSGTDADGIPGKASWDALKVPKQL